MRSNVVTLLSAGDMSGNLTSSVQNLQQMICFAVQAVFTGSPVGSIKLQASNDGVTYTDVANSSFAISAAGDTMWNVTTAAFLFVRCVYTFTSGTGSLTVKLYEKGV